MHLGNGLNAILSGNVTQVVGSGWDPRSVKVSEPRSSNIDRSGRKGMSPRQNALLSESSLITLLETATVGHAAENAGNELRIVDQAEPKEQRVPLVEIDVQSAVKAVAIFFEFRRIREIGKQLAIGWKRIQIEELDGIRI